MTSLELHTKGIAAGGDAVARDDDGRVVFVDRALPGETVTAEVTDERRAFARARVLDVIDASPARVTPPCPNVERGCGGCDWQHAAVDEQRRLKAEVVADALRRSGRVAEPEVRLGTALPAEGYRTTLRMAVTAGRPGFRRARSHQVLDVDLCLVAHPLLAELVAEGRFDGATEVTLRCGARTGERLVLASPSAAEVQVPDDVVVVGADELAAGRRAWIHEEACERRWRVSASSFFQTRPDGAEALVDAVRAAATDGDGPVAPVGHVVDAYGGVGLFAGALELGERVTLVERSPSAVADARVNLAGRKSRILQLDVARWRASPADLVVADPARTGLGQDGVAALTAAGADRLVLVSCDPAALGRDVNLLRTHGYEPTGTTMVDLFPHTSHIEAVTGFVRTGHPQEPPGPNIQERGQSRTHVR